MKTLVRLLAVTALAAALTSWPVPAHAGGPTSVLLVSPGIQQATALYIGQPRYQQLDSVLHSGPSQQSHRIEPGPFIVATWMIHDASIWRIDRIFMDAPGGPWIATEDVTEGQHTYAGPEVSATAAWHKSADPEQLRGLLKTLGLYKTPKTAAPGPAAADPSQPAPAPAKAPAVKEPGVAANWWWALPGLLIGALLTLAAGRLNQPRGPYETKQELFDRAKL